MARIPYVDPASAPPEVREAFERIGVDLKIFRLLAHAETAFVPFLRFGGTLPTRLALDPALRQLAILQVAQSTGAEYEWVQHEAISRPVGVSDEQIDAVRTGEIESGSLSESQQAVLAFARETVEQVRVGDKTFDRLAAVLPPREIVELLLVIGSYRMLAGVMEACRIDLDPALAVGLLGDAQAGRNES